MSERSEPVVFRYSEQSGFVLRRRGTMNKRLPIFFAVLAVAFLTSQVCFGAVTGKISGTVKDTETGEALFPANIIVETTVLGAASRPTGEYFIINVPPGTYSVRAKMMGYRDVVVEDVVVRADFT
jgi:hypothetical protein